jgi:hypothetical protein
MPVGQVKNRVFKFFAWPANEWQSTIPSSSPALLGSQPAFALWRIFYQ